MTPILALLLAPVAVSWQLLEIKGLQSEPATFLVVMEDSTRTEGLKGGKVERFHTVARAVQETLKNDGTPSPRLTADYLAAGQELPRIALVRSWLRLGEDVVRGIFVSDSSVGGTLWVLEDSVSGERVGLLSWLGRNEELEEHLKSLFSERDEKRREDAQRALARLARSGTRKCQRVMVQAAGRTELLPCNANLEDMAQVLALLWPEVDPAARVRLGAMMRLAHSAHPRQGDVTVFPYYMILKGLAVPPAPLGLEEGQFSVRQLEPTDWRDFLHWRLPQGEQFRPYWGERELRPSDLSLSFARYLRALW